MPFETKEAAGDHFHWTDVTCDASRSFWHQHLRSPAFKQLFPRSVLGDKQLGAEPDRDIQVRLDIDIKAHLQ